MRDQVLDNLSFAFEDLGAEVAAAMTDAAFPVQEAKIVWAQVAPRRSVDEALTHHAGTRELATALNVHFLIRGNVTRAASGYNVEMLVVDGATERVLGTQSLTLAAGALTPRRREQLDDALGGLLPCRRGLRISFVRQAALRILPSGLRNAGSTRRFPRCASRML